MANSETSWTDSVNDAVNGVFEPVSKFLGDIVFYSVDIFGTSFPLIVGWLVVAGAIFSIYFGFAQVRHLKTAFRLVRGKYEQKDAPGEISHFQALTSAVSGTVGLGNIAGVAIAISIGGPGATFWMILCGFLGMATKFVECTLGVKYREFNKDGTVNGGPMLYLRKGLAERGWPTVGKVLAALSAVMILFFTFFGGNLFQINQSLEQLVSVTGKDDSVFGTSGGAIFYGLVIAGLVALVLIGGMRSIGAVTSRLVPSMALLYVTACLLVIGFNLTEVPNAIATIVSQAFNPEGVAGGVIGALIVGFQRAAFSNEAGIGSAPIAHSAVKTKRPATEGLVAMIEPFIDTVVICTMTALTIIIAGGPLYSQYRETAIEGGELDRSTGAGISITSDAFETALPWFPYVLTVAVILFAFSTVITWSYYGLKSWGHLFGHSKTSELVYKVIFCTMVVTGALLSLGVLVDLSDATLFLAALFNIVGLYLLAPVVKKELRKVLNYARRRDAGDTEEQIEADEAAEEAAEAAAAARTSAK
ncbi:alanine/glycine:cation symporter family protein [Streptomyces alkaliterrae]|uniref:Alanine:cation symporter family protein n=1 Tax=Streptomyces alkaliterrae TaxID=2213162 RepID=A0A5P0YQZ1_9ACTN|nr:alanine/glycine:cation symporter family protein [Streptomyces alkaliterrae]MBB1256386.1 alanine:cation symporter family protein [Streptomyces alkaliterrae]MBB1262191.1 alanine:cation symporter family protein [Streptomyces alkaliterrae]MQS02734.1 amino acid carrier protein [Streptomyces alkaliterrae]